MATSGTIAEARPQFEKKLQAGADTTVTYGTVNISASYVENEVQAISTALTNLVTALRNRGVIL